MARTLPLSEAKARLSQLVADLEVNEEESAYPPQSGWLAGLGRLKDG